MRTMRELGGWAILVALWVLPVAFLVSLVALAKEGAWLCPVVALLGCLAWPALRLAGRRMRTPPFEELAEVDGRKPVLVLHRFAHVDVPLRRRLYGLDHLVRDHREMGWLRALRKSFESAGPIVPFARPAPPPSVGPVSLAEDDAPWRAELDRRLKQARLCVIALDASAACRHEIERAFALLGPRRTVLLMPPKPGPELEAAWPGIRALVPALPAFDSHVIAYRFQRDGSPVQLTSSAGFGHKKSLLASPTLMLLPHEPTPAPRRSSFAIVLMAVPTVAALIGTVAVPVLLQWEHVDVDGDQIATGTFALLALGVTLSVMARRAFRAVPANELPFVVVAALPWLVSAGGVWLFGEWTRSEWRLREWLEVTSIGAAYATPLLLGVAVTLAGAALLRRAEGRTLAHATFAVAALIPIGVLVLSLDRAFVQVSIVAFVLAAAAVPLAMAAVAATGTPRRPHAPLPLGAAAAATLAIAAWLTVVTLEHWRRLMETIDGDHREFLILADGVSDLARFGGAWVWALAVVPSVIALIAITQEGRASRVAVGSVAALVPLVALLGLSATAQAGARTAFARRYVETDALLTTRAYGGPLDLARIEQCGASPTRADVAIVGDEVWMNRAPHRGGHGLRPRVRPGVPLGVAIDRTATSGALRQTLTAAAQAGATRVGLIGRSRSGYACAHVVHLTGQPSLMAERILVVLTVSQHRATLAATDGTNIEMGRPDIEWRLRERHQQEPNRRDLFVQLASDIPPTEALRILDTCAAEGFDDLGWVL